ncbi:hypothetical protein MUN78_15250 [Leucobacter allii]|uniref:Uncharacterized protein n=1 Tax=Leucobacter allii TaxID=2932247 RepID=A0ABY4FL58_9MICO|nr:hypothetical protein [Leucobacter allii]UOQ57000.1 hypothetical protein MUN78_15250 [Leucobacter allii]UOR01469.1 hypothetical protein MUN77_15275 [Leucobacter allii]
MIRKRHLRRGSISTAIGVFCGAAILVGWISADWDPNFHVSGRRYGLPLWLASVHIGVFGAGLVWFGISQLRAAALFRPSRRRPAGDTGQRDP